MKRIYTAADPLEASLLKAELESTRIACLIQGEYLTGGAGELSALSFPELWVMDDRDERRARELIQAFRQRAAAPSISAPWYCPRCGESHEPAFDICWQCGAARPA